MRKHLLLILLLAVCFPFMAVHAESEPGSIVPSVPTSPQAEAFKRVGEYTVNNSSGMPDISIPLYQIEHCGYTIPLALRYMATPLKPGYNYDVYGFGWTLTAGSCISRTIEALPDEEEDFKLSTDDLNLLCRVYADHLEESNWVNDKFSATLPDGSSFDFVILNDEYNGFRYVVSGARSVKIECQYTEGNIQSFEVTDEQGVKYLFDIADTAFQRAGGLFNNRYVSWYLSRIELPHAATPILFDYGQSIKTEWVWGYEEPGVFLCHYRNLPSSYPGGVNVREEKSQPNSYYKMRLLSRISYGSTSVNFDYYKDDDETAYNYMKHMTVKDGQNVVRDFRLDYRIDNPRSASTLIDSLATLTRLVVSGGDGSADSLVYSFAYTGVGGGLLGTDHWGNCNQQGGHYGTAHFNFFVEFDPDEITSNTIINNQLRKVDKNADELCPYSKLNLQRTSYFDTREPAPVSAHNLLTSITYPTGGRTEFKFGNHRFITATGADGDYIRINSQKRVVEGGGFRINKITNYTSDGKVADVQCYKYGLTYGELCASGANFPGCHAGYATDHTGYGEPVVDPNILTYCSFAPSAPLPTSFHYMLLGLSPAGRNESFTNPFATAFNGWYWECRFSPLNFRKLLHGRTAVAYPEITVYHGEVGDACSTPEKTTGKTVYKYNLYKTHQNNDTTYFEAPQLFGNVYACEEYKYKRDLLQEKLEYVFEADSFQLVRRESYTYNHPTAFVWGYLFANIYAPAYYPGNQPISTLFRTKGDVYGGSLLAEKDVKVYLKNGVQDLSESYSYNSRHQMKTQSRYNLKYTRTDYVYPQASDTASAAELQMVERNMISPVLSSHTYTLSTPSSDSDGYRVDYNVFTVGGAELLLPERLYKLGIGGTAPGFEEVEHVLSYSSNGNPKEAVGRDGTHTVYLWSYNDRYLVAEIRNATSAQVETAVQALFATGVDGLAAQASPDAQKLGQLRSQPSLSDALVTVRTYKPLVGVTSETDPAGSSTFYDYDALGRLTEVYRYEDNVVSDANKQMLKQYTYHTTNH